MVQITIRGRKFDISKQDIINAVKGEEPRNIKSYSVEINGKDFPIKQPVELATKLPAIAFTSMDAYRLLDKLGFEIKQQ